MFQIITKAYNCADYIERCILTVKTQIITDWKMTIVIDPSDDWTFSRCAKYAEKDRIEIHCMDKRMYGTHNIAYGINNCGAKDEDIIVCVDGDDYLCENDALFIVKKKYDQTNCLLTYGSFMRFSTGERCPAFKSYDPSLPVRKQNWNGSHLKTFKYKLWKKLPKDCLLDSTGNYIKYCDDMAFMFSMIELAGWDKVQQIKELLYMYNDCNPENAFSTNKKECKEIEQKLRNLQPLSLVSF